MEKYNSQKIEKRWQKKWEKSGIYNTQDNIENKENFFLLTEFPYPSGNLHIGHWYAYALPDIMARYLRMRGSNVLYPIGFDAFGLPAENAAIKNNLQPKDWTEKNIAYMTKQFKTMGASFDWSRSIKTIDPEYYRWTQWMFIQFYKKGLAYRAEAKVNWCPKDETVLANEQVIAGKCFRCGNDVFQKELPQWMLRITDYADRLIDDLEKVDYLPSVKASQENWIGHSEGAEIIFPVEGSDDKITIFTTRADTLAGATYIVLAPEHPLVSRLTVGEYRDDVNKYLEGVKKKSEHERFNLEKEKTGVFTGRYVINPLNDKKIPVWVADYVAVHYGTGAVMAVPAHDERDFEFAKKYALPSQEVIMPTVVDHVNPPRSDKRTVIRKNVHAIVYDPKRDAYLILRSEKFGWDTVIIGGVENGESYEEAAAREVREETGHTDLIFKRILGGPVQASYFAKHKDENRTAISIAVYFELVSEKTVKRMDADLGEVVWIPAKDFIPGKIVNSELSLWLERLRHGDVPYVGDGVLYNSGKFNNMTSESARTEIVKKLGSEGVAREKINYKLHDWVLSRQRYWGTPIPMINCKSCGYQPVSEDELPVRLPELEDYKPSNDGRSPLAKASEWLKVKCPKCSGDAERETDTMDTFVDSSWYFLRYTDHQNKKVFAEKAKITNWLPVDFYSGGAEHTTMHLLYSRFWIKAMHDLDLVDFDEPYKKRRNRGLILGPDGQKMSKSRGNVIDPDEQVAKYGADTVRMYLAFLGPYDQYVPWDPKAINGIFRFINRIWSIARTSFNEKNGNLDIALNKAIKKIGEDIEEMKFNTAISELMKLLNKIEEKGLTKEQFSIYVKLLAPFAPHLAEEIWNETLVYKDSIHLESWPVYNPDLLKDKKIVLPVQINGKVRATIDLEADASEDEAKSIALGNDSIQRYIGSEKIKNIIYVTGKILNIII